MLLCQPDFGFTLGFKDRSRPDLAANLDFSEILTIDWNWLHSRDLRRELCEMQSLLC